MIMSIEINQFNANTAVRKHRSLIFANAMWHRVEVENCQELERDVVLNTLMTTVHPADFIPVSYKVTTNGASFLIKNCGAAIEKFCAANLIVVNNHNKDKPFKLKVVLNVAKATELKVDVQKNVMAVLNKRFNAETGVLNLDNFSKDPELEEFCALSQPKLLFYILHLSKNFVMKQLKLSNNDIEILKPLEALYGVKTLTSVDLRNNNIKRIYSIQHLKELRLTELFLDGNPICESFDEFSYPRTIRETLDKLERLDGMAVAAKGFLPFRRNFLCDSAGHDLVNQFLEHYFTIYDTRNRHALDGVYHKAAMFSITSVYLPLQSTSLSAKLNLYKKISRNLKQISDFSKNNEFLFRGSHEILRVLDSLPATEHDPYTFTVDLMMYTEKSAVIVVTGVFREGVETLLDTERLLGFTRTFVLLAGNNNEYSIINEQLHISNATSVQATRAFKLTRTFKPHYLHIPSPQSPKEQNEMAEALKAITGLNLEWAGKCLEECQYDLKKALVLFVDLFKVDKIPQSAFVSYDPSKDMQEDQPREIPSDLSVGNVFNNFIPNDINFTPFQQQPFAGGYLKNTSNVNVNNSSNVANQILAMSNRTVSPIAPPGANRKPTEMVRSTPIRNVPGKGPQIRKPTT